MKEIQTEIGEIIQGSLRDGRSLIKKLVTRFAKCQNLIWHPNECFQIAEREPLCV